MSGSSPLAPSGLRARELVHPPARGDGVGAALRAAYRRTLDDLPAEFRDLLRKLD